MGVYDSIMGNFPCPKCDGIDDECQYKISFGKYTPNLRRTKMNESIDSMPPVRFDVLGICICPKCNKGFDVVLSFDKSKCVRAKHYEYDDLVHLPLPKQKKLNRRAAIRKEENKRLLEKNRIKYKELYNKEPNKIELLTFSSIGGMFSMNYEGWARSVFLVYDKKIGNYIKRDGKWERRPGT